MGRGEPLPVAGLRHMLGDRAGMCNRASRCRRRERLLEAMQYGSEFWESQDLTMEYPPELLNDAAGPFVDGALVAPAVRI